jgi:beta-lactamase class A
MTLRRFRFRSSLFACVLVLAGAFATARASELDLPGPLAELQSQLDAAAMHAPGRVGIAVEDLATGVTSGINASMSLPAASTIKIPVMVEVFEQLEAGTLQLDKRIHLESRDRDWGWGDLADAEPGTTRSVKQLLWLMITDSDNTATNMLIRVVGRARINATMRALGLRATRLSDDIRTDTDAVRYDLRTSPKDMLALLDAIARDRLVDEWSSRQMLAILAGQTHNSLLPEPLPNGVKIAHKTGSLHDTLNDVGIVYHDQEPYVIAVMTTQLPDLELGRRFIHKVSRIAYDAFERFASWREERGIAGFAFGASAGPVAQILAPDERMWHAGPESALPSDGEDSDR